MSAPWPTEIRVRASGRTLDVTFDTGERFELPAALLRVMTPAATRGHGGFSASPLAIDKPDVSVKAVTPIGRYAVRLGFDDGHDTGLFTWEILHRVGRDRAALEAEHRRLLGR